MTTAIDSNVLIDVIGHANVFTAAAIAALDEGRRRGGLIVSPVVAAETASHFASPAALRAAFEAMHIELRPFAWHDLHRASESYTAYCRRSSKPRSRMLADFLVGAHAEAHADALLTRDRGSYATYFPKVRLIEPQG